MNARFAGLAVTVALVLAASGCGGDPSRDICERVTLAHVNGLCGTAASATMAFDEPGTDYDSRSCFYDGVRGADVSALRFTFHDGAAAAQARFVEDRGALGGNGTITDLSAPGDDAFYLEDLPTNSSSIYVVQGDVSVTINDNVVSAANAPLTMQCLTVLASEVLAVR